MWVCNCKQSFGLFSGRVMFRIMTCGLTRFPQHFRDLEQLSHPWHQFSENYRRKTDSWIFLRAFLENEPVDALEILNTHVLAIGKWYFIITIQQIQLDLESQSTDHADLVICPLLTGNRSVGSRYLFLMPKYVFVPHELSFIVARRAKSKSSKRTDTRKLNGNFLVGRELLISGHMGHALHACH